MNTPMKQKENETNDDPFWDVAERVCAKYEMHLCDTWWLKDGFEEPDWSYTWIGGLILICPVSYLHLDTDVLEQKLDELLQRIVKEEMGESL